MPKEFDGIFAHDPNRQSLVESQRQKIEEQQASVELAQRREMNSKAEVKKHDVLVTEVLESLIETAYPEAMLSKGIWGSRQNFQISEYWQIGFVGREAVGRSLSDYTEVWKKQLTVGLVTDEEGIATGFRCNHMRSIECALTRDALVDALLTIHKPELAYPKINSVRREIKKILEQISASQYLKKSDPYSTFNINGYAEDLDFNVPELGALPSRGKDGEIWGGALFERIPVSDDYELSALITVDLVIDEEYVPTHYRCIIEGDAIDVPVDSDLLQVLKNMLKGPVI